MFYVCMHLVSLLLQLENMSFYIEVRKGIYGGKLLIRYKEVKKG